MSDSEDISLSLEEEILSKAECEAIFRNEVKAWLDENAFKLFTDGMPMPKLVNIKKGNPKFDQKPFIIEDGYPPSTPKKPPYKKQRAELNLNETQYIKK